MRPADVCGWARKPSCSRYAMSLRTVADETRTPGASETCVEPTGCAVLMYSCTTALRIAVLRSSSIACWRISVEGDAMGDWSNEWSDRLGSRLGPPPAHAPGRRRQRRRRRLLRRGGLRLLRLGLHRLPSRLQPGLDLVEQRVEVVVAATLGEDLGVLLEEATDLGLLRVRHRPLHDSVHVAHLEDIRIEERVLAVLRRQLPSAGRDAV